ncbi:MAG: nucleotide exchange factor GrpE [Terriglobia bacterium]
MNDEPKAETQEQGVDSAHASAETGAPAQVSAAEERISKLTEENKQLYDQLLRRQADFENFRKRLERDQQAFRQAAETDLLHALLPVLDAFERALAAPASGNDDYRRGVELIYKQLFDVLARFGLKPVEAVGKAFDPFLHHAVERVQTADHPDQQVVAELQRGYLFKDKLLRPALVRVAVHPADEQGGEGGH